MDGGMCGVPEFCREVCIPCSHFQVPVSRNDVLGIQQVDELVMIFAVRMAAYVEVLKNARTAPIPAAAA